MSVTPSSQDSHLALGSFLVGLRPLKARLSLEGARLGVGALLGALVPVGNCLVLLVRVKPPEPTCLPTRTEHLAKSRVTSRECRRHSGALRVTIKCYCFTSIESNLAVHQMNFHIASHHITLRSWSDLERNLPHQKRRDRQPVYQYLFIGKTLNTMHALTQDELTKFLSISGVQRLRTHRDDCGHVQQVFNNCVLIVMISADSLTRI